MHPKDIKYAGTPVEEAKNALIMLHGRGGSAENILSLVPELKVSDFAVVAPEAYNNSWYPLSFLAPVEQNEPWLTSALDLLKEVETDLNTKGISSENIYFFGFSQGACLTLEYVSRNAKRYGGVAAIIGGLIGDSINTGDYISNFASTPVLIATSNPDPHVPLERVEKTVELMKLKNAQITFKVFENAGHSILPQELMLASELYSGGAADHMP